MQIDVQALGLELTPALREHTERRLHFALGRSDTQVSRLWVRLSDLNGPRGGETNYVMATVTLFVAIFNLFASLLQLLGFMNSDD